MAFDLRPLQRADVARAVAVYFAAFGRDAQSLGCWPRTPRVRAGWEAMVRDELDEPGAHWLQAVAAASGEMAGFAKWVAPQPGRLPDIDLPQWPEGADADLCSQTYGALAEKHRSVMGRRGHWYLEILAIDPAYQRQGAASQMMQWGVDKADEQNVEAYLDASPDAVSLYEKFGFREADRTDIFIDNARVTATWYRNLMMTRPAKEYASHR